MKLALILCAVGPLGWSASLPGKPNNHKFVFCHFAYGARLFESPDKRTATGDVVTYGERIIILDPLVEPANTDGYSGEWLKIRHGSGIRYVNSGLTSEWKPVADTASKGYFKEYLYSNFELTEGDKNFSFSNGGRCRTSKKFARFGSVDYYGAGTTRNMTERIILSDFSVQEAYLVFSNLNGCFLSERLIGVDFKDNEDYNGKACKTRNYRGVGSKTSFRFRLSQRRDENEVVWICHQMISDGSEGTLELTKNGDDGVLINYTYRCY